VKFPGRETWQDIKKVSMLELPKGSIVRIRTSGGGGWGPPEERSNAAIAADVLAELVTQGSSE
jgi:N-methylhydantoinase B